NTDGLGIDALRALWAEAERRMYPLATVSPEKYERLIRLVREAANDLALAETADQLAARWADGPMLVQAVSARLGLSLGDLPELDVAGAAFALRDGEIRALEHERLLAQTITEANGAGRVWALLHERGTLEHGLMDPYQAIELHLESGAAIVSSVEPNPVDGRANHVLTVIRLDRETGAPVDLDPGIAETQEHPDSDTFSSSRAELRSLIEGF
ncbi:MAG: hypothetical protein OEU32_15920, partial [Acidimicrobiia bacterium]|nr:hypothetical protein [Acidimicrobiia bacterium]